MGGRETGLIVKGQPKGPAGRWDGGFEKEEPRRMPRASAAEHLQTWRCHPVSSLTSWCS
jgi:hypothetical protein